MSTSTRQTMGWGRIAAVASVIACAFRMSVNARCMEATDPRDPVFRLSVIALRTIGDEAMAERRAHQLEAVEDPSFQDWLERARKA